MQREVSAEEMRSNPVNIAHAKAWMWGVESDCENLMVFEDDAFFDGGSIAQGAAAVDKVVESGAQFDLLLLGYGIIEDETCWKAPGNGSYDSHLGEPDRWKMLHACLVSRRMMEKGDDLLAYTSRHCMVRNISKAANFDDVIGGFNDLQTAPVSAILNRSVTTLALRPMIAFQQYHPSTSATQAAQKIPEHIQRAAEIDRFYLRHSQPEVVHSELEAQMQLCS